MTTQVLVTVLPNAERKAYKSDKGYISKFVNCQCIVHSMDADGVITPKVGVLRVPEAICPVPAENSTMESLPDVPGGDYIAEFALHIDYKSKEIGGRLAGLVRRDQRPAFKGAEVKDGPKQA